MLDHSLLVLFAIEVLSSGLGRTVLQENPAVLAVKLLAHRE
jgi:hypothetical protein